MIISIPSALLGDVHLCPQILLFLKSSFKAAYVNIALILLTRFALPFVEWLVAKPFSLFQGDFDGGWHLHRKMDGLRRILIPRVHHGLLGRLRGHLQLAWYQNKQQSRRMSQKGNHFQNPKYATVW